MANMIAIRAHSCARARARARITGPVQLHSDVGLGSNEYNSTAGCFRLRARVRFTENENRAAKPIPIKTSH